MLPVKPRGAVVMDTDFQSQLRREDLSARSRILHVSAVLNEVLMSIGNIGNICVRKHLRVSQVEFSEPIRREALFEPYSYGC